MRTASLRGTHTTTFSPAGRSSELRLTRLEFKTTVRFLELRVLRRFRFLIFRLSTKRKSRLMIRGRSSITRRFSGISRRGRSCIVCEVFAKPNVAKNLSDKARAPAKNASQSDGSDRLNCFKEEAFQYEAPNQSFEGMKQFNMSYHKTSQGTNDRTNGKTHIAQLRAVPGFTCFIEENHPLKKIGDKAVPPPKIDVKSPPEVNGNLTKKKNSDSTGKFESQSSRDILCSIDKSVAATERKTRTYKISSSSSLPANLFSNKSEPKRSMDSNLKVPQSDASKAGSGYYSPPLSDEELDVNSAAAASVAALRKAIEKAQASLRIAKEVMERKKDGPQRFSKPSSKDGLDIKNRREDKVTRQASIIREKGAKEVCESADNLEVFTKAERVRAWRNGKVAPDLKESEEISIGNEAVGETNESKLGSAEDCEELRQISELANRGECRTATLACEHADGGINTILSTDAHECRRKEMEIGKEILEQIDKNGKKVDDEAQKLEDMKRKLNTVKTERCRRKEVEICEEILELLDENGNKVDEVTQKLEDLEGKLSTAKTAPDCGHHDVLGLDTAQEVHEQEGNEEAGVALENDETGENQKASTKEEKCEKELEESLEPNGNNEFEFPGLKMKDNEGIDETQGCIENEKLTEILEKEQIKKSLNDVHEEEESKIRPKKICEPDEIEKIPEAPCLWEDCKQAFEVESIEKRQNDAHEGEDNEKGLSKIHEMDINNKRLDGEESEESQHDDCDWERKVKILVEGCEYEETAIIQRETDGNETAEVNQELVEEAMSLDATCNAGEWDAGESERMSEEAHSYKQDDNDLDFEENERISDVTQSSCEFKMEEIGLEAVEGAHEMEEEVCKTGGCVGRTAEHTEIGNKTKDANEALLLDDNLPNIGFTATDYGLNETDHIEKESELNFNLGSGIKVSVYESVEGESNVHTAYEKRKSVEMGNTMEACQQCSAFKGEEKTIEINEDINTSQITGKNEENPNKTFAVEGKETKETEQKGVKAEKEHLRKNEEVNKREREREKDRMAVERAIREARERAFAEARERAERAAVERATSEARKRVMAETREKIEKASAAAKSSAEKASIEAKLRAERAAVERATVEARERALEKALSQKGTSEVREQAEKYFAEKFPGGSRDNGLRQSFPSSDTKKLDENSGESAERCKARSERHQMTVERAAKALAEKNMRDLLAQKEQAERNRLAETLDADVKRWSSGKEGNLRALLSTLHYIVGPDSGWQPISLTDIITTNAVKKAYRKATLQVHPDKLQQRGASIQQKYICEKVFDLLKAAWNRFNSEDR
ncbi:auxilin-like protein 1 isoform X2 [Actinidia eriantha]|uniref:auxilin-like protein 1 isoform X2 n=1 Tax=Actinidia eriantha TaxID=165200 RepID=UPI00258CEF24|nr:auxilin-like protein 1 isoform X2 [Actinidia eriantha]